MEQGGAEGVFCVFHGGPSCALHRVVALIKVIRR